MPHKGPSGGGRGQRTTLSGPTGQGLHATRGLHRRLRSPRPNLHSPEKEYGDGSTSLIYFYSSRQGQQRAPSPLRVVRFLGASHERRMGAKGALTEHPPGAGAPTGHPPGGYSESLVVHFFFWRQSGSSDLFWYMFWAQGNSVCKVNGKG